LQALRAGLPDHVVVRLEGGPAVAAPARPIWVAGAEPEVDPDPASPGLPHDRKLLGEGVGEDDAAVVADGPATLQALVPLRLSQGRRSWRQDQRQQEQAQPDDPAHAQGVGWEAVWGRETTAIRACGDEDHGPARERGAWPPVAVRSRE